MSHILRISVIITLVILFVGCSSNLPRWDVERPGQTVYANEDDIRILEVKANECFNIQVLPYFKKAGIEIKPGQKITKGIIKGLKKNLTVDEWEKLTDGINEWIKINRQLKATKTGGNGPDVDFGVVSGNAYAPDRLDFWFEDGRLAELIGVRIPTPTSKYRKMSIDMFYKLALGKTAKIEYDAVKNEWTNQFLYVYIHISDIFVNKEMVSKGYARAKPTPQNSKYDDLFKELEKKAKESKSGIWALTEDW